MSEIEHTDKSTQASDGPDASSPLLVEIAPGWSMVFAEEPPAFLDLVPPSTMSPDTLADTAAVATGIADLLVQGTRGAMQMQGLVQLSPQTVMALKRLKPFQLNGYYGGTLRDAGGKFAHSVRWKPAGAIGQGVTVLSSLGPAASQLAMAAQLADISRKIDVNIELTRSVLRSLREDQWATLIGLYETTARALAEAQAVGAVTDHIFSRINSAEADLRKQRVLFVSNVRSHLKALEGGRASGRDYLREHGHEIVADSHGMLMAEESWYRAQVLRAAHIARQQELAPEDQRLLDELIPEIQAEHATAVAETSRLLRELERHSLLQLALPPERSLPFGGKRPDSESAAMAATLAEVVCRLMGEVHRPPESAEPRLAVFAEQAPEALLRILPLVLDDGDEVLALADVNLGRWVDDDGLLGVTSERLFFAGDSAVCKKGLVERSVPLEDVRYVRFREREKKGPVIEVLTKDENLAFTFGDWARSGEALAAARTFGDLLASAMNLPESECRANPLAERAEIEG